VQLAAAVGPASLLAAMNGLSLTQPIRRFMPQQAASITAAASCRQSTVRQALVTKNGTQPFAKW
jgi:hypothetical protein